MSAFQDRILELVNTGNNPRAIAETLKVEGIKTPTGKAPTLFNIRTQVARLKKRGFIHQIASKAAVAQGFDATTAKTCTDAFLLAKNVLNNDTLAAERKIEMLKVLFR